MKTSTINSALEWLGKAVIALGGAGVIVWLGGKWGKACDRATAEDRLVGEKNADQVGEHMAKEVLPRVAESLANATAQKLDKALNASPPKNE